MNLILQAVKALFRKVEIVISQNTSALSRKIDDVEAKAGNAQATADNAQATADNAQATADNAQATADNIPTLIDRALSGKMDVENPVGTGSFSLNRKSNTTTGDYSVAEGYNTTASGHSSHAEGSGTIASCYNAHAEGSNTIAAGAMSHAEGCGTVAFTSSQNVTGQYNISENSPVLYHITSSQLHDKAFNVRTTTVCLSLEYKIDYKNGTFTLLSPVSVALSDLTEHPNDYVGYYFICEISNNDINGIGVSEYGEAMGSFRSAPKFSKRNAYVYNISNPLESIGDYFDFYTQRRNIGMYAHIVGNGTSDTERSNAHTLDWDGVPWYQGRPQFGGNAQDDGSQTVMANGDKEIFLASSTEGSTKRFRITVDDTGTLTATEITEATTE